MPKGILFSFWWSVGGSRCFALKGSRSRPLAGLIQAGFDHRLLERSPDVLADADALSGPIPLLFVKITIETVKRPSLLLWWTAKGCTRTTLIEVPFYL